MVTIGSLWDPYNILVGARPDLITNIENATNVDDVLTAVTTLITLDSAISTIYKEIVNENSINESVVEVPKKKVGRPSKKSEVV